MVSYYNTPNLCLPVHLFLCLQTPPTQSGVKQPNTAQKNWKNMWQCVRNERKPHYLMEKKIYCGLNSRQPKNLSENWRGRFAEFGQISAPVYWQCQDMMVTWSLRSWAVWAGSIGWMETQCPWGDLLDLSRESVGPVNGISSFVLQELPGCCAPGGTQEPLHQRRVWRWVQGFHPDTWQQSMCLMLAAVTFPPAKGKLTAKQEKLSEAPTCTIVPVQGAVSLVPLLLTTSAT